MLVHNGGLPYADVAALSSAIGREIELTRATANRQLTHGADDNLSWPENTLDALHAAATEFQWRPAATTLRTIIHVPDASFWDVGRVSSAVGAPMNLEPAGGCSVNPFGAPPFYCTTVGSSSGFEDTIRVLRDHGVWVNTFAAKTGGPPGDNPSPASHGAFRGVDVNVGIGFFEPYGNRPSIADSTGGLAWDIDEVFDGTISLATPIQESIAGSLCMDYPPIPLI